MSIKNVVNSRLADISTYDGEGKVTGLGVGNIVANAITSAGNITANGMTINGNAIITGNANVQGNLTYNNITNLTTSNLVLGLGNNQSGINVTGGGIVVGNTAEAQFLYNQPTSTWNTNSGISANGNISGSYILGNGSQLTGLPAGYTNANVTTLLAAGNVSSNIITTANVSGTYFLGNGSQLTGLPATYGNANVTNLLSSGNVSSNVVTTANVNGAILNVTSTVFAGIDVITGNIANLTATKTRITSFGANCFIQTGNGTANTTGNIIFAPYANADVRVRIDTSSGNLYASGNIFDQTGQLYGVAANYYYAGFATQPANATTGSTVIFNGQYETSGSGITYNSSTGIFTLQPGTYSLNASLGLANYAGNGELDYVWAYAGNTTYIGSVGAALAVNLAVPAAFQTIAQGVLTVTTPTQVKLYALFAGGPQYIAAAQSHAYINQIGGQAPFSTSTFVTKASGIVNAGVDVTLGNLKVRMPTSGNRSLQVSTITGTYTVYGSCSYVAVGSLGGQYIGAGGSALTVTTTPTYLKSIMNFTNAGDTCTWIIVDTSQAISWRIELIVGFGFNDNMISIERMV